MRQYIANRKASDAQTRNITPSYNFPIYPDLAQVSDSANATAGGGGTPPTQSDSANASDAVTNTTANTGTWHIPFDAANSTGVTNPIAAVGEFDVGL